MSIVNLTAIDKAINTADTTPKKNGFGEVPTAPKDALPSPEKKPKIQKKESELVVIQWVRAGWEVPEIIREDVNRTALDEKMDRKDVAHAILDYGLKNKHKINFRDYHKPKNR